MLSTESRSGAPTDQSSGTADAAKQSAALRILSRNAPRICVGFAGAFAIAVASIYWETGIQSPIVAAYGGFLLGWVLPQFKHVTKEGGVL